MRLDPDEQARLSQNDGYEQVPAVELLPLDHRLLNNNFTEQTAHGEPTVQSSLKRSALLVKECSHWQQPSLMLFMFSLGVGLAAGHHVYYKRLDGREVHVRSPEAQQWPLRVGNAFAISIALCLKTSAGIAFVQYLWLTLSRSSLRLRTIDCSFELSTNIFAFFNWELAKNVRVASFIALIIWILPINTLFSPATLSVEQVVQTTSEVIRVSAMNISNVDKISTNYTYLYGATWVTQDIRLTPRVSRIIAASAYSGDILPPNTPSSLTNASYSASSFVPLLRCSEAGSDMQTILRDGLNKTLNESTPTWGSEDKSWSKNHAWYVEWTVDDDLTYYNHDGNSGEPYYISAFGSIPTNGSGEVLSWNGYKYRDRYDARTVLYIGLLRPETHFSVCDFWNASVKFTVDITGDNARVSTDEPHYIVLVDFNNIAPTGVYNFSSIAYSNFLNEGSKHITGMIEKTYDRHSTLNNITTRAQDTFLSTNIQWARMMHNFLSHEQDKFDETLFRNKTFAEDVEYFFLRASMGLLNDRTLCEEIATEVTSHHFLTVYTYRPVNLKTTYGISILFCAISVMIGTYAFWINGVAYDTKPTTFGMAMRQPGIKDALFRHNMFEATKHTNEHGSPQVTFVAKEGFQLTVDR